VLESLEQIIYSFFDFSGFSEEDLAIAAKVVQPPGVPARRIGHPGRRKAYYAGRAAVAVLARELNWRVWVVPNPEYGYLTLQPQQGKLPKSFVNISHTDGIAVAVISPVPVGIDVEAVDRSVETVLNRMTTTEELREAGETIAVANGTIPSGVALWSGKEAFSKALGLGIRFGLSELRLHLDGVSPFRASTQRSGIFDLRSPGVYYECHGRYVVAICSDRAVLAKGVLKFAGTSDS
jgi:phosphopantetheinyl transferase